MKPLVLTTLLLLVACSKGESAPSSVARADVQMAVTDTAASDGAAAAGASTAASDAARAGASTAAPAAPRMIVRNASLAIVVRDSADVLRRVTALVEAKRGYVAETKQWKEREQVRASATLRVPSAELAPVLSSIRTYSVRVESEEVTADDVSEEFADLGAQLRNLEATETELRELLNTVRMRTQKASEVLEVHREMSKIRGEIDRIQGRRQFLSQQAAMSTIKLELIPDVLAAPVIESGWQPVATVRTAGRALINSLKTVADLLIWIVLYVLPLGALIVALALLLRPVVLRLRDARERLTRKKTDE